MLEEVCASSQGPANRFVQSHLDDLKKTLLDSLKNTASPAKRVRAPDMAALQGGRVSAGRPRGVALTDPMLPFCPQPRLKCLIHIVKKLSAEHEEFIAALIPEVSG